MMTKKDFETVAGAVALVNDDVIRGGIARNLIYAFSKQYPNFDHEKFMDACNK